MTTVVAIAASLAVIDGDTVHSDQERYRLLGIDAAEIITRNATPNAAWVSLPS